LKPHSEFGIYHRTDRIPGLQIGDLIMDDPPRDTKSMDDMVFDKLTTLEVLTSTSGIASAHFEK